MVYDVWNNYSYLCPFKKEKTRGHEEAMTSDHSHPCPKPPTHWVFPWIPMYLAGAKCFPPTPLFPATNSSPIRAHEVEPNTNYRMWSLVSREIDSLLQRDSTNNSVNCKGAFSDTTGNSRCSLCFLLQSFPVCLHFLFHTIRHLSYFKSGLIELFLWGGFPLSVVFRCHARKFYALK